jgi:hypothetical protein
MMKKILMVASALTVAIGLSACSSKDTAKTDNKETKEVAASKETDVKKPLVKFYMDLGQKINDRDVDLNTYETKAAKAATDPTVKITPEMKTKASAASAAVAAELNNIQIPAELKDQKSDLEAAVKDIAASYQMKADELKKDTPSMDAANASFTKGQDELGKVFESVKLLKPDLSKQVN